jgi:hypothetical protein
MPPQQPGRLLDLGDDILNFGTHGGATYQESGVGQCISGLLWQKSIEAQKSPDA